MGAHATISARPLRGPRIGRRRRSSARRGGAFKGRRGEGGGVRGRVRDKARVAARVRADLQLVVDGERDLQERIHDSARSLWQWTSFMIRANTLGLTDGVDVRRPIGDRLRMALNDFREGDDDDLAEDDIQTSWDSIHLESNARFADDDLDDDGPDRESFADEDDDSEDFPRRASASDLDSRELIRIVGADEWAKIKSSSFLVTAGVVKDATLQGKWSVKAGAMTFARDEFDSDAPEALDPARRRGDRDDAGPGFSRRRRSEALRSGRQSTNNSKLIS
eukprot:CAMPEP_0206840926 /NCGR_PEP_ID=MMETSP0975-20121206/22188_1 /ASSEMBLY_ACC=CAM_ASM_000399 /TAXON_ID=483370 /ORGANISM="non described non described, Strain CCMP2097" /LENGTH=277 /DNA_ID=CAMNT_0054383421 /DNA_START=105 /DNA_END=936 /DNA_ORIENTATION=+